MPEDQTRHLLGDQQHGGGAGDDRGGPGRPAGRLSRRLAGRLLGRLLGRLAGRHGTHGG
ncbi:hypothetical protein Ae406Ps2_0731 [Pseudonocardia sp. Ae406_Ps2]|nr:hypothetical protein Ae406Ps2_0731 [Pseudonocardia sp. Ae406_Ps2]OLM07479.1 hypothetical protein Ae331Ps2_5189c [Pseudonocardia sp. Ae331_Ps2]OLM14669.1 hypothetical protein Ae505Ps2_4799c [Pseudonocardia sp. Ae505_Ps2]OLM22308.1 hypothetical protein Ae706Ps2_0740 [Pseudonocardia sp. Ae706_Ps2]